MSKQKQRKSCVVALTFSLASMVLLWIIWHSSNWFPALTPLPISKPPSLTEVLSKPDIPDDWSFKSHADSVTSDPIPTPAGLRIDLVPQLGHSDAVTCVTFSVDGARLLSGSKDGSICLWDATTGTLLRWFSQVAQKPINSVSFCRDGWRVLTASQGGGAVLWNALTGEQLAQLADPRGDVSVALFDPSGLRVLTGGKDRIPRVWDLERGGSPLELKGHSAAICAASFSTDGREILTGSTDGTSLLWDARSGAPLRQFKIGQHMESIRHGEPIAVTSVAFSPGGKYVLLGGEGSLSTPLPSRLRLLDKSTGEMVKSWNYWVISRAPTIISAVFRPGVGQILAVGGGQANLFEIQQKRATSLIDSLNSELLPLKPSRTFAKDQTATLCAAVSPNGRFVATGANDNTISLWDASGQSVWDPRTLVHPITSLDYHRGSDLLATGGRDGIARVWDLTTGKLIRSIKTTGGSVAALRFDHDGKRLVTGTEKGEVGLWDVLAGPTKWSFSIGSSRVTALAFSRRDRIGIVGGDNRVRLRSATTGGEIWTSEGAQECTLSAEFVRGGQWLLVGNGDESYTKRQKGKLELRRPGTYDTIQSLETIPGISDERADRLAVDRDGGRIMAAGPFGLNIWGANHRDKPRLLPNLSTVFSAGFLLGGKSYFLVTALPFLGLPRGNIEAFGTDGGTIWRRDDLSVQDAAASADGERIVVGCGPSAGKGAKAKTLRVLDSRTGRELLAFPHDEPVFRVAVSPDGTRVASDGTALRLWDAVEGSLLNQFPHDLPANSIAFSRDGRLLLTGDSRGLVQLWGVTRRELISEFRYPSVVSRVCISPDNCHLLAGGYDGRVIVWDRERRTLVKTIETRYDHVNGLDFDGSGTLIVLSADSMIRSNHKGILQALDIEDGRPARSIAFPRGQISALAVSESAGVALVGNLNGGDKVRMLDLQTWETRDTFEPGGA
jgi:WD40 repeat protein